MNDVWVNSIEDLWKENFSSNAYKGSPLQEYDFSSAKPIGYGNNERYKLNWPKVPAHTGISDLKGVCRILGEELSILFIRSLNIQAK